MHNEQAIKIQTYYRNSSLYIHSTCQKIASLYVVAQEIMKSGNELDDEMYEEDEEEERIEPDYELAIASLTHAINYRSSIPVLSRKASVLYNLRFRTLLLRANLSLKVVGGISLAYKDLDAATNMLRYRNSDVLKKEDVIECFKLRSLLFSFFGADSLALRELSRAQCIDHSLLTEHTVGNSSASTMINESIHTSMKNSKRTLNALHLCSASEWHRARRYAMTQLHPELMDLYNSKESGIWLSFLLLFLCSLHVFTLFLMSMLINERHLSEQAVIVIGLAVTIGSFCAYGFQALNHELCHVRHQEYTLIKHSSMLISSALCLFPWALYYLYYHLRHHAYTGAEYDRDGEVLFLLWHSPPSIIIPHPNQLPSMISQWVKSKMTRLLRSSRNNNINGEELPENPNAPSPTKERNGLDMIEIKIKYSKLGRYLWTGVFGFAAYMIFLYQKSKIGEKHNPRMKFEGLALLLHGGILYFFSIQGFMYLILSFAFSMGAFGHPYLGFWLIQHALRKERSKPTNELKRLAEEYNVTLFQPTVSYSGSYIWSILNFGELQHVEHHDFPNIPDVFSVFTIQKIAPEFYESLETEESIFGAIKDWVNGTNDEEWMEHKGDFAGRNLFLLKWDNVFGYDNSDPETESFAYETPNRQGDQTVSNIQPLINPITESSSPESIGNTSTPAVEQLSEQINQQDSLAVYSDEVDDEKQFIEQVDSMHHHLAQHHILPLLNEVEPRRRHQSVPKCLLCHVELPMNNKKVVTGYQITSNCDALYHIHCLQASLKGYIDDNKKYKCPVCGLELFGNVGIKMVKAKLAHTNIDLPQSCCLRQPCEECKKLLPM